MSWYCVLQQTLGMFLCTASWAKNSCLCRMQLQELWVQQAPRGRVLYCWIIYSLSAHKSQLHPKSFSSTANFLFESFANPVPALNWESTALQHTLWWGKEASWVQTPAWQVIPFPLCTHWTLLWIQSFQCITNKVYSHENMPHTLCICFKEGQGRWVLQETGILPPFKTFPN